MLMFSFPEAQLRGPREKLVTLRAVPWKPCVCVAVGQWRWRRPEAASCSMAQRTFFAVSSNSSCLLLVSFAILFLALSLSSFKNSLRVNSSNCFLTERKAQPDECFLCSSIGSSSGSQPSNSLKQKKHWAKSGSFSGDSRWSQPWPSAPGCRRSPPRRASS